MKELAKRLFAAPPKCLNCDRPATHAHPDGGAGGLCETCYDRVTQD